MINKIFHHSVLCIKRYNRLKNVFFTEQIAIMQTLKTTLVNVGKNNAFKVNIFEFI